MKDKHYGFLGKFLSRRKGKCEAGLPPHPHHHLSITSIPENADKMREKGKLRFDKVISLARKTSNPGRETLIRALIRPIQSDYLLAVAVEGQDARMTLDENCFFFSKMISYINEYARECDINRMICLNKDMVLPWPWKESSYEYSTLTIGTHIGKPWVYDPINHYVDVLMPWNIGFVGGGNHSIAAGVLACEGELKPRTIRDASDVFKFIHTDGNYWFENNKILEEVRDYRTAAVFEIGRMLISSKKGKGLSCSE